MSDSTQAVEALVVLCTVPDGETAEQIARRIVEEEFAACCNIIPGVKSIYRWQGKVEEENEYLLVIKTTASTYEALQNLIVKLHPYETPEIISLPVSGGLKEYLDWLNTNTGAGNARFAARNT